MLRVIIVVQASNARAMMTAPTRTESERDCCMVSLLWCFKTGRRSCRRRQCQCPARRGAWAGRAWSGCHPRARRRSRARREVKRSDPERKSCRGAAPGGVVGERILRLGDADRQAVKAVRGQPGDLLLSLRADLDAVRAVNEGSRSRAASPGWIYSRRRSAGTDPATLKRLGRPAPRHARPRRPRPRRC